MEEIEAYINLASNNNGVAYYEFATKGLNLCLFGQDHFWSQSKTPPLKGDICSKIVNSEKFEKVGTFNTVDNKIKLAIYGLGKFETELINNGCFKVIELKPKNKLDELSYNVNLTTSIPDNTELSCYLLTRFI